MAGLLTRVASNLGEQTHQANVKQVAAGTDDSQVVYVNKSGVALKLTRASYIPENAMTANGTNFVDLALVNKGAAGVGTDEATDGPGKSYAAGSTVALTEEALTLNTTTENNKVLQDGEVLALDNTNSGAGLQLEAGTLELGFIVQGDE